MARRDDGIPTRLQLRTFERHRGVRDLGGLTAVEELSDGTENVAQHAVSWRYEDDDVVMSFTLDRLQPTQYATLRWENG